MRRALAGGGDQRSGEPEHAKRRVFGGF
jgi:hypothetical protein